DRVVSFYTLDPKGMPDAPLSPGSPRRFVSVAGNVGLIGYAAGRDVFVVDQYGLADPVASRLRLVSRLRAGPEKSMEVDWAGGRFADRNRWPAGEDTSAAIEAQRALGCDGLAR